MKIESGENDIVVQSLTQVFTTQIVGAGGEVEIQPVIGDTIVINVFAANEKVVSELSDNDDDDENLPASLKDQAY